MKTANRSKNENIQELENFEKLSYDLLKTIFGGEDPIVPPPPPPPPSTK